MSTNKQVSYFVFKGEVGFYNTKQEAIFRGGSVTNVIELTTSNTRLALPKLLMDIAHTRRDIDFKTLYPFIKEKDIRILESIKCKHIYTTAYINRIISESGVSTYGIWFCNDKHNYCYISDVKLNRKHVTDEVILLKLNELSKKYGFVGTLKTPFPLPQEAYHLRLWNIEAIKCYGFDLPMTSLVEVLQTGKSIIPVDFIK